jgi:hypothetical protein
MKLSEHTVNILKNFSTINQNILVKEGSELQTMSTMKNILGTANVSEAFPRDFGIYDLNEFLGVLTLVSDAELKFDNDSYLTVNGGRTKIRYFYSDPSILTTPPETFNPPECDVTFEVSKNVLTKLLKASAVMQLPDVVLSNGKITATDLKNVTSNKFTEQLDDTVGDPFEFRFKADNLKMIPGDYNVSASTSAGVSNWVGKEASYWIAMEANTE